MGRLREDILRCAAESLGIDRERLEDALLCPEAREKRPLELSPLGRKETNLGAGVTREEKACFHLASRGGVCVGRRARNALRVIRRHLDDRRGSPTRALEERGCRVDSEYGRIMVGMPSLVGLRYHDLFLLPACDPLPPLSPSALSLSSVQLRRRSAARGASSRPEGVFRRFPEIPACEPRGLVYRTLVRRVNLDPRSR